MTALPPTKFAEITKLEVSNSSMNMFHSCERKFEFRKLFASSRHEEGYAAGVGTALHIGIQHFLEHGDFEAACFEMMLNYPIHFQKTTLDQRSLEACYASLHKACHFDKIGEYELAYFENADGSVTAGTELAFTLRLQDYPFYADGRTIAIDYIGFIDLIMYNKMDDSYLVWDIKTTTKDTDMSVQFAFDEQCLPYGLVLEALLGRDYTKGFEVAYWVLRINPTDPKNLYYSFMKTGEDVQEWVRKYLMGLADIKRYYNMGWFPRRGTACMSWNRPCQFFDLCANRNGESLERLIGAENANLKPHNRPASQLIIDLHLAEGSKL